MIKELQETTFPARVAEIEEICGKAIPDEVDWDTLADDGVLEMLCPYPQGASGMRR